MTDRLLSYLPKTEWLSDLALDNHFPLTFRKHGVVSSVADFPDIPSVVRGDHNACYGPPLVKSAFGMRSPRKTALFKEVLAKREFHKRELLEAALMSVHSYDPDVLFLSLSSFGLGDLPSEPVAEWSRVMLARRASGLFSGDAEMLGAFISLGYGLTQDNLGYSLLSYLMNPAVKDVFERAVPLCDKLAVNGERGDSLLHLASYGKADISYFLEVLPKELLERKNLKGMTPLLVALRNSMVSKVVELSQAGADWSVMTERGVSAQNLIGRMNIPDNLKDELMGVCSRSLALKMLAKSQVPLGSRRRSSL